MVKKTKIVSKKLSVKKTVKKIGTDQKEELKTGSVAGKILSFDAHGAFLGEVTFSKALFDVPYNSQLIAQSVRVYLANQRTGNASTKTRGEVEGSTRKIYKQKGTGRARHGGIRAPIFVGGGIAFGPRPRDYHLKFPKKMKHAALLSAISEKRRKHGIVVIEGLEKLAIKTKLFQTIFAKLNVGNNVLVLIGEKTLGVVRAIRNIPEVTVYPVTMVNTYDVTTHHTLCFTKDAFEAFIGKKE